MSGIFGLLHLDGAPVLDRDIAPMQEAMARWGVDRTHRWQAGSAALGQCLLYNTPEALFERAPEACEGRFAFTCQGRVDNRKELLEALDIPSPRHQTTPDGEIMRRAYERWGEESPGHLLGDWSFAAFDLRERTLFLARDHHGKTALYYYSDTRRFAFASDRAALLALPGVARRLNEPYLAKVLVGWPGFSGPETAYLDLMRLPPAHSLRVNPRGLQKKRYWSLDDVETVRFASDDAYVERFLELFQQAVSCRLRSHRPIGLMLSAGLDSGAICSVAAPVLRHRATPLTAFTGVPLSPWPGSHAAASGRIVDEWDLAHVVATHTGSAHVAVAAEHTTPLDGVHFSLLCHGEPLRSVSAAYWVSAILKDAAARGIGTMLDGDYGNVTISWSGAHMPSHWRRWARAVMPAWAVAPIDLWRDQGAWRHSNETWRYVSPIRREFAGRVGLSEQLASAGLRPGVGLRSQNARAARLRVLQPGAAIHGAISAELGAATQIESRDPTADVRLLSFLFAIPDAQFQGPPRRWLVRRAMTGKLPDAVRLNQRRGLQGADLIYRLRRQRSEIAATLDQIETTAIAGDYLDFKRMRDIAQQVGKNDDLHTLLRARAVLLRGIAAGLFLRDFTDPPTTARSIGPHPRA